MIIKAPCGAMEGMEIQGIHQFLGIPYAKPPTGFALCPQNRQNPGQESVPAENWATLRLSSMYRDLLF